MHLFDPFIPLEFIFQGVIVQCVSELIMFSPNYQHN